MNRRDQSEDYSRPHDVLVYRDTPQGIVGTPIAPGAQRLTPSNQQLLNAAEALLLLSGVEYVALSVDDLRAQLVLDRGICFDEDTVAAGAYGLFDLTTEEPPRFAVTHRWLRTFRNFLDTRPAAFITADHSNR